jgi:hypothetical protein
LSGGTGADAFVLNETGSANLDHIVDYNAAEGDKIDLQALLDANFNSGSDIDDFVKLTHKTAATSPSPWIRTGPPGARRAPTGSMSASLTTALQV